MDWTRAIIDKKFDTTDVLIVLNSKKILKKYSHSFPFKRYPDALLPNIIFF